jgi:hypothetical protein
LIDSRVSDPHHFYADPDLDSAFDINTDPDPAFHFNPVPNSVLHQGDANLRLPGTGLQILQGAILRSTPLIGSVHGPPRLHFEPLKILKILTLMRIHILLQLFHFNQCGSGSVSSTLVDMLVSW